MRMAACKSGIPSSLSKAHDGKCVDDVGGAQLNDDKNCVTECGRIANPVCGSNNKTYFNRCTLEIATCQYGVNESYSGECYAETQELDCPAGCPKLPAAWLCSNNGVSYDSQCAMRMAACKSGIPSSLSKAHDGKCVDDVGGAQLNDDKNCVTECGRAANPVCGSNNKTYLNSCTLKIATCQYGVTESYSGKCGAGEPAVKLIPAKPTVKRSLQGLVGTSMLIFIKQLQNALAVELTQNNKRRRGSVINGCTDVGWLLDMYGRYNVQFEGFTGKDWQTPALAQPLLQHLERYSKTKDSKMFRRCGNKIKAVAKLTVKTPSGPVTNGTRKTMAEIIEAQIPWTECDTLEKRRSRGCRDVKMVCFGVMAMAAYTSQKNAGRAVEMGTKEPTSPRENPRSDTLLDAVKHCSTISGRMKYNLDNPWYKKLITQIMKTPKLLTPTLRTPITAEKD
eukprot:GHVQ01029658.1.p1 GENE.GHVQ01029658.1~~GHVQ01029658.1.p1  ORF type:complete len:450 (+),score=23.22 GHVQ01029658.1:256-1605(+)